MGGGRRPRPRNLAPERVVDFYEEATRGRSASHHLQVKAALALLYHVLGSPNPFAQCHGPKFAPEKTELRYHTSSQLGQLLRELREDKASYFGHLTYHLATTLFFTGCRFHEWAFLTMDRLVREPGGDYRCPPPDQRWLVSRSASHPRVVGFARRSGSLSWKASRACGCGLGGIDFAGSPLVFPGRDGAPFGQPVAMERKLALSDLQLLVSFLGLSQSK